MTYQELRQELEEESRYRRETFRKIAWAIAAVCACFAVLFCATGAFGETPQISAMLGATIAAAILALPLYAALGVMVWACERECAIDAVYRLSGCLDVEAAGPLIDALAIRNKRIRAIVIRSLTLLLPRVTEEDAFLFLPHRMERLHKALDYYTLDLEAAAQRALESVDLLGTDDRSAFLDFHLSILRAIREVGDAESLRCLSRLTAIRPASRADVVLRQAARECLSALQEKLRNRKRAESLVRPAMPDDRSFLRPASTPLCDTASLPRAAEVEQT